MHLLWFQDAFPVCPVGQSSWSTSNCRWVSRKGGSSLWVETTQCPPEDHALAWGTSQWAQSLPFITATSYMTPPTRGSYCAWQRPAHLAHFCVSHTQRDPWHGAGIHLLNKWINIQGLKLTILWDCLTESFYLTLRSILLTPLYRWKCGGWEKLEHVPIPQNEWFAQLWGKK